MKFSFKERLEKVWEKLTFQKDVLGKARRRAKKFRLRAEHNEEVFRKSNKTNRRAETRAKRSWKKYEYWRGRIKSTLVKIHHLEDLVEKIEKEQEKYNKTHGFKVEKNNVIGPVEERPHEALKAALLAAYRNWKNGDLPGYYSQSGGARDYLHTLYHYALHRIWDCSTFADGVYICCKLPAPSGPRTLELGGWTGTQGEHGKKIDPSDAQPGDLVLYGSFPHHHVEVVLDPKTRTTVGHGSPPIDLGVFDLFGDGNYIVRRYV